MSGATPKILVVDDDERNHRIMKEILEEDFELVNTFSGEEALEIIKENEPDIILLDIMMPGMDGYEVCEKIKKDREFSAIPVVFVSAKDQLEDRIKGYSVGAEDYFVKPFNDDELLLKVKKLLEFKIKSEQHQKNIQDAHDVAMQAMTNTSELGEILRFLQYSFTARDYKEISDKLFSVTHNFGLRCVIQFRDKSDTITLSSDGVASPMETSILLKSKSGPRIVDYKDKTIFTYGYLSLLVKNMPIEDEARYGVVKDNLCYLLDGAEARVKALMVELDLHTQKNNLVRLIKYANKTMQELNKDMHDVRVKGAAIVEDMLEDVHDVLPSLSLDEEQENMLVSITEDGVKQTTNLFNEGIRVDEKFSKLLTQLEETTNSDLQYASDINVLLSNL